MESHNGSGWTSQAEMTYNGLGIRLTSSALGITTQYASDGQLPLTISSGGNTTTILYGMGPVAEKMDEWNFVQTDGFNLPRQLTNMAGEITMSVRYNPWGKPIETDGIGNFDASFIGTLIDATTGLIYVGNGQYYDPETGRFLTRGVNPNSTNPYMPFDPTSLLLAPLGLMAVFYAGKKSKKSAPYLMMLLLMVILPVSIGLACGGTTSTPAPAATTPEVNPAQTQVPDEAVTLPSNTPAPTETPTPTVTVPPPCCDWLPIEFKITHYATVLESDSFFPYEAEKYVPIFDGATTALQKVPKWRFYLGNEKNDTCDENCKNWSVYVQGSGRLTEPDSLKLSNGKPYAKVDINNKPFLQGYQFNAAYYFTDQNLGACGTSLESEKTIAVYFEYLDEEYHCGDKYYIEGFEGVFTVRDTGTFYDEEDPFQELYHFDIYVGEQTYASLNSDPRLLNFSGSHRVAKAP